MPGNVRPGVCGESVDPGQPIAFEEVGARHLIDMEPTNEGSRPAGKVARVEKAGQRVGAGHAGSGSHAWQESGTRMIDSKLSDPSCDRRSKEGNPRQPIGERVISGEGRHFTA